MGLIERRIESIEKWPLRKGKRDLLNHLKGESLTRGQAITAMCYECCAGEGGPCTSITCPLYSYSQYRL